MVSREGGIRSVSESSLLAQLLWPSTMGMSRFAAMRHAFGSRTEELRWKGRLKHERMHVGRVCPNVGHVSSTLASKFA